MRVLALTLCLAMTAMALPATAWLRDDLNVLASDDASGDAAWGVKVSLPSDGDIAVEANIGGPQTDGAVGAGGAIVDASGVPSLVFTFTGISSPDRSIGFPIETTRGVVPTGLHISLTTPANRGQPGTDATCTFLCLGLESDGQVAGDYYYVVWGGGGSSVHMEVKASSGSARVTHGSALTGMDADARGGDQNIQYQTGGAGVKLIRGASIGFTATGAHSYGAWYDLNLKLVCGGVLGVGVCVTPLDTANYATNLVCGTAIGSGCGLSVISVSGAISQSGSTFYSIQNGPPGAYSFNIDSKVDAYYGGLPFVYDPITGSFVFVYPAEDWSILSIASVDLPA